MMPPIHHIGTVVTITQFYIQNVNYRKRVVVTKLHIYVLNNIQKQVTCKQYFEKCPDNRGTFKEMT
jgi:hypothetical protein